MNLHNFVAFYDYKKHSCPNNADHINCLKLKNDYGYLHKRLEPKLIKVPHYKLLEKKYREKYFHQILMLFKPWFKEDDLLNNQDNYEAAFKFEIDIKTIDTNLVCQFENQKQKIEDAIEYTHRLQQLVSSSENDSNEDDLNETINEPYLQNHLLSEMANK